VETSFIKKKKGKFDFKKATILLFHNRLIMWLKYL
jgi:hypothetical protein